MQADERDPKLGDPKVSDHAPAPHSDDALSPGNVIRQNAEASRSERLGDGTPSGPVTSPPVDPERT